MSTKNQMLSLLHKDLIIMKRSKCRTCCEITIPLIFLPILLVTLFVSYKVDKFGEFKEFDDKLQSINPETYLGTYDIIVKEHEWYTKLKDAACDITIGKESTNKSSKHIEFLEFDVNKPKFRYIISDTNGLIIQTGWKDDPFNGGIDLFGEFPTSIAVQRAVDEILLRVMGKSTSSSNPKYDHVTLANIKHPRAWRNVFNTYVLPYFAIIIVFVSLIPIANAAKGIIVEVESEIKVYLLVLGMTRVSFYFSHLINNCVKLILILFVFMIPCVLFLKVFTSFVMYGLVFLFILAITAYALFWATIIHRPGVCMAVIILSTIVLLVLSFVMPDSRLNMGIMCLGSLNPVHALRMGLTDLTFYDQYGKQWPDGRLFYQFNAFLAFVFLVIDIVLLICITLLLDLMLPSAGQTGISFSTLFKRFRKVEDINQRNSIHREDFEASTKHKSSSDVKVVDLVKQWDTGEVAVNGVSFSAHQNEITCLLGHNGAGKSTTFSCLTGYTKPTSGQLLVCGLDIQAHLTDSRKMIGYCPQINPLYNQLTCAEHLRLAAKLRGTYHGDQDVFEVLDSVGLSNAVNVEAEKLSGGMKRKLCVALALIGKSKVVLLDEPTAGMDPTARKQIADILDKYKKERTIILTTHYMDEADLLGDKIIILVKGQVVCSGSSAFLKKRFGTGFLLTITMNTNVKDVEAKSSAIIEHIQIYIPEAKLEGSPGTQFIVNLPYESKTQFSSVFSMLEQESTKLEIDTFGLSVNTLEQVFIKVGEKAEGASSGELRKKIMANADTIRDGDDNCNPNFLKKFIALFIRNLTYLRRNPIRSLVPFAIMLLCFGFLIVFKNVGNNEDDFLDSIGNLDKKKVVFHRLQDLPKSKILVDNQHYSLVKNLLHSVDQCKIESVGSNAFSDPKYAFDVPPPTLGYNVDSNGINTFANQFLKNGQILAINLYSNLKAGALDAITVGLEGTIPQDFNVLKLLLLSDVINALCVVAGVSYGLSTLLSEVITERVKKFKYQLYLAGTNSILYWGTQLITDFLYIFVLSVIIIIGSSVVAQLHATCVVGASSVWLLYFLTASMASYVMSFWFSSPTKGSVFLLAFHTIIPFVVYIFLTILVFVVMLILRLKNVQYISANAINVVKLGLSVTYVNDKCRDIF